MKNEMNWSAPSSFEGLNDSTWHVMQLGKGKWQAGHFALTGHGDAMDARGVKLPTGRTPGRALRSFRRLLQREPVEFK